jgi:glycerol-3-phosphate dehydrogenase
VPWGHRLLVGVWHQVHDNPEAVEVSEQEVESWIGEVNHGCPLLDLRVEDVACYNSGLTLFGENRAGSTDLRYGHRSLLLDHHASENLEGLITAIGVRLTVARALADRVLALVGRKLGRSLGPCRTAETPLAGGEMEDVEGAIARAQQVRPTSVSEQAMRDLVRSYGSEYQAVIRLAGEDQRLGAPLGDSPVLAAQVVHAVRNEMAQRVSDVVYRRTGMGAVDRADPDALDQCASIMGTALGWSQARCREEVDLASRRFPGVGCSGRPGRVEARGGAHR